MKAKLLFLMVFATIYGLAIPIYSFSQTRFDNPEKIARKLSKSGKIQENKGKLIEPVEVKEKVIGHIDWMNQMAYAVGFGFKPQKSINPSQARIRAKRAAIDDAYAHLLEIAVRVRVDSELLTKDFVNGNGVVRISLSGIIKNAEIIKIQEFNDGSFQVQLKMPLLGSNGIASTFFPAHLKNPCNCEYLKNNIREGISSIYIPLAVEVARNYGIPESLFLRLIYLESRFDPFARSPKGALGLGQLMPATARELGLRVKSASDHLEGSVWHPYSNMDASAKYLRDLYELYREKGISEREAWYFAAGAYNAGMGNINEAIALVGLNEQMKWDYVAFALPRITGNASRETIRFVKRLRKI